MASSVIPKAGATEVGIARSIAGSFGEKAYEWSYLGQLYFKANSHCLMVRELENS
jgi:hypothetical protein